MRRTLTLPALTGWVPPSPAVQERGFLPFLDLAGVIEHRNELVLREFISRPREHAVEDCDLRLWPECGAQADPFVERRDKEQPAARRLQRLRHRRRAEPIG